jgi:hypothetical protein
VASITTTAIAREGLGMERITSNQRLEAICVAGRGVVYNDFSGGGASGAQYNVVHSAACRWLARSNLSVAKLWFEDLAGATAWLVRERGEEGRAWKRCRTCRAVESPIAPTQRVRRQTTPTARPQPLHPNSTYAVVAASGGLLVEAWSSIRLPFEPTGAMREFRDELRSATGQLSAGPGEAIHARYTSPIGGHFDVENVLLYNVGTSAFARSARFELVIERDRGPVPSCPRGLTEALHHYRYEIVAIGMPWRHWSAARPLASFGPIDVALMAQVSNPSPVWYAVRRGGAQVLLPAGIPSVFGLELVLETPAQVRVNLAAITKPLLDGVVAAFHAHDDPASLDLVAGRVAVQLGASTDEVRSLLSQHRTAILGARRLLWPWRTGVQWNPADDLCAAIRISNVPRRGPLPDTGPLRIQGSVVEIAEADSPN